jgi:Zn-dependent metalloprotease
MKQRNANNQQNVPPYQYQNNINNNYNTFAYQGNYPQNQNYNPLPRKKKHRFLKFLLMAIVLFAIYKISSMVGNNIVQKEFDLFVYDYPFEFENEFDSLNYITGNFTVPTQYEYNNKVYNVSWKASTSLLKIKDGNVLVDRPSSTSTKATLTCVYKKWYGKATKEYQLVLIPQNSLTKEDVNLVSIDNVKNGTYSKDMEMELNEDGYIKYMYGDFGSQRIYSEDDALAVIEAYKDELGLKDNIKVTLSNISSTNIFTTYTFDTYIDNLKLSSESLKITTKKDNNKLVQISSNIQQHDEASYIDNFDTMDFEAILDKQFDMDYIYEVSDKIIEDNIPMQKIIVLTENLSLYNVLIDNDGDIVSCKLDGENSKSYGVEGTGKDELGNSYTFQAAFNVDSTDIITGESYRMEDVTRKITIYEQVSAWEGIKKNAGGNKGIYNLNSLVELIGNGTMATTIDSKTSNFDNPVAVQTFVYLQNAYDWYKNNLNYIGYDNKGSQMSAILNWNDMHDNASWRNTLKVFTINPASKLKYSVSLDANVMAHEYTHAVFTSFNDMTNSTIELDALNEAYADIFGCLSTYSNDWTICKNYMADTGDEVVFRDLKNINADNIYRGEKYPTTYHGENWSEESHNESVLISHIAYEMYASSLFSYDEVVNIWYESLGLGYEGDSTFVDCRKNVIKAATSLKCNDEQLDFIANAFDEEEIFDEDYVYKTKTSTPSIDGDAIYDDTTSRIYLMVYSMTDMMLSDDAKIVIIEQNVGKSNDEDELSKNLTQKIHEAGFDNVSVVYKQVPAWQMNLYTKICSNTNDYVSDFALSNIGVEDDEEFTSFIQWLIKLVFDYKVINSTPYDFYMNLQGN